MKFYKGMNLLKLDLQHFATSSAMSTSNQYIKYSITITQNSQSITGNTSNVTVVVKVWRTNSGYTSYDSSGTCYCKINGTTYSQAIKSSQKVTQNSNTVFFTKTLDIPHNADGSKTLTCSAWFEGSKVFSASEQSYSQTLTTIARASTLGTISNFTIGNDITIPITKNSNSFADTLNVYVGDTWIKRYEGLTNGQKINFTTAELNTIYANIPNSTTATFKFVNTTYNGANVLGTSTKTATGTIPSSIKPTISNTNVVEANTDIVPSSWGVFVKNKSKLKITTTATAGTGSSISAIKTTIDGATYVGSPTTTNVITESGNLTATIIATDKRGRTATSTKTISVVDYAEPYIDKFSVVRCDSSGNANDKGTYAKVTLQGGIYSVNGKNTPTYAINYKKTTDTEYQTHTFSVTETTIDETVILSDINENNSYEFVAVISDYFTSENPTKKSIPLSSAFTTVDYLNGGKGIAFGKVAEKQGVMDIAFDIQDKFGTAIKNGLACYGSGDNAIDLDTTIEHLVLTNKNTPSGGFMYVQTFFYHEKSTTANRTQMAVPYNSDGSIYYRYYYNGAWSGWSEQPTKKYVDDKVNNQLTQGIRAFEGMWDGTYERLLATATFYGTYQRDVLVLAIGHSGYTSIDQTGIAIICPSCAESTTLTDKFYCPITTMGDLSADDFNIVKSGNKIDIYFKKNNHYRTYFAFCLAKTDNITLH